LENSQSSTSTSRESCGGLRKILCPTHRFSQTGKTNCPVFPALEARA